MKIKSDYLDNLGEDFFALQNPEQVRNPDLLVFNDELAKEIGFEKLLSKGDDLVQILSGNKLINSSKPLAMAYAGHQFGHFVPSLGDGRAVLLGEIENDGRLLDLALKGSGKTYFSRGGDGKCPLFSAVKEYLFSEFLHYLGVKTTRSLSVVKTDEIVLRQDGPEVAAVISRVSRGHIRIGTLQYFAARRDLKNVKKLADYAINRHYPDCHKVKDPYFEFFKEVSRAQIDLIASWMSFGFIHGVMNTDNILICGETIDFGPCAFMEKFNRSQVFSSIDKYGRYAFDQQKQIIIWNLTRFAESILRLICDGDDDADVEKSITLIENELVKLSESFDEIYYSKMAKKIGIFDFKEEDRVLIDDFLDILEENELDFTNAFRSLLGFLKGEDFVVDGKILNGKNSDFDDWSLRLKARLDLEKEQGDHLDAQINEITQKMNAANPSFTLRNYMVIKIANQVVSGDLSEFEELLEAIKKPFTNKIDPKYSRVADKKEQSLRTFCGT